MKTCCRAGTQLIVSGVLATVLAVAVAGCGSSGPRHTVTQTAPTADTTVYGTLPTAGSAKPGATLTVGQLTGGTPTFIFPIVSAANGSGPNINLIANLFLPLYNVALGAGRTIDFGLSAADSPRFSDRDRVVTIPLKHGLHWADGAPVDASDVLFDIALIKAAVKQNAASWAAYTPGLFPDNLRSATAPNRFTVVLHLDRAYNPGFFLNNQLQVLDEAIYPLPSTAWNVDSSHGPHLRDWSSPAVAEKIFDYLAKAGGSVAAFASDPLWRDVDGPFSLKSFSATNGSYMLVPNRHYGLSPRPQVKAVSYETFTSSSTELTELKIGALDVDPDFDTTQLGEVASLRQSGVDVFGGPDFGWSGGVINFKDTADHFDKVIAQLYVRQALAHLIDQPDLIKGIYKNLAAPAYGPVPAQPQSPYAPADAQTDPYPYHPATAAALLRSHGWKVAPGGQTVCVHAGVGAGRCGAGIPAGTPLKFTWATESADESASEALSTEAIASIAKQAAGIDIVVETKDAAFLYTDYDDQNPAAKAYTNDWGVLDSGSGDLYFPTQTGIDNTGGVLNYGDYSDPTADRLMRASVMSSSPSAVSKEASYLETHLPDLFLPNNYFLDAVSDKVGGSPASWLTLTQLSQLPQFWFVK